ncbi:hypothetical protein BV898_16896 [Hypsibius exemplaris]|uniref:Uncharacterized protein n=1 Tax=Hypsibius exemplaris TaxID=2072580 RepID=A0A9X6NEC7_HYPEX|nr:hypothetical protein BV898_16896 [Hypsibius exemplaris]
MFSQLHFCLSTVKSDWQRNIHPTEPAQLCGVTIRLDGQVEIRPLSPLCTRKCGLNKGQVDHQLTFHFGLHHRDSEILVPTSSAMIDSDSVVPSTSAAADCPLERSSSPKAEAGNLTGAAFSKASAAGGELSGEDVMDAFEEYLDLRDQEVEDEPFVAPVVPHRSHSFTESFRLDIINWMFEVSSDAFVHNIILHHAIHLLDAVAPFLVMDPSAEKDKAAVRSAQCAVHHVVQLVAICSINVMQKVHADYSDLFCQIQKSVERDFNVETCEWVEMLIQQLGRPGLRRPTSMGFARIFVKIAPVPKRVGWLMTYLSDLVLVHGKHLRRARYCIIAAALYVVAVGTANQRDNLELDPWPFNLAKFTRIDFHGLTGGLLEEMVYDIHQLQKDFTVPEQGLLPSHFLQKYRSVSCMGVAAFSVMSRASLDSMIDELKVTAAERAPKVQAVRNEPANLFVRPESHGISIAPLELTRSSSGSKGRYFSNPENSQPDPKKQRISDPADDSD